MDVGSTLLTVRAALRGHPIAQREVIEPRTSTAITQTHIGQSGGTAENFLAGFGSEEDLFVCHNEFF